LTLIVAPPSLKPAALLPLSGKAVSIDFSVPFMEGTLSPYSTIIIGVWDEGVSIPNHKELLEEGKLHAKDL